MRLPDGALRAFKVRIPPAFIAVLPRQLKYIYLYELLWPVLATFIWRNEFGGAYPVFYEDNESAQFSLLRGFSNRLAPSLFLACFWGASAAQCSRPWISRVASGDNPADALTKPGVPAGHLDGAVLEDDRSFDQL
jgi:hypothetical protein